MKTIKEISDEDVFKDAKTITDRSDYFDRISTRAILLNNDGELAMIHFAYSDLYLLPGGRQEDGETLEDTLIREIKEETGYDSKIIKEIGLIIDYKDKIKQRHFNHCYIAEVTGKGGDKLFSENEIKNGRPKLVWMSLDDAFKTQRLKLNTEGDDLYIAQFTQVVQKFILETFLKDYYPQLVRARHCKRRLRFIEANKK